MTTPRLIPQLQLEPRTIKHEFDETLKGSVHDGLWMLTQQFRTGEFNGEDAASPIFAKISFKENVIHKFKPNNDNVEAYNQEVPLEALVEKMPLIYDWTIRIQMGTYWIKLIKKVGITSSVYLTYNLNNFKIELENDINFATKDEINLIKASWKLIPDGKKIYDYLISNTTGNNIYGGISNTLFNSLKTSFINWFEKTYYIPKSSNSVNWDNKSLEYKFSCSAPSNQDNQQNEVILKNNQYHGGKLDWYSVDIDSSLSSLGGSLNSPNNLVNEETLAFIPSSLKFKGMPVERWWQFEDKNIDMGGLKDDYSNTLTNLSKLSIINFALNYSNDWFVLPYKMKRGRLYELTNLIVKNVIDEDYITVSNSSDPNWNMFSLKGDNEFNTFKKIFIPSNTTQTLESEPIEKVIFLKDEMANIVWGVEKLISNNLGGNLDGNTAQNEVQDNLYKQWLALNVNTQNSDNSSGIEYNIMNTVPENWIPFVPAQITGGERQILYKRGKFYRILKEKYLIETGNNQFVSPRTSILSYGLNQTPKINYQINEEEILRSGTIISTNFQRTRWYNGKIINWLSRKRTNGLGESNSGLKYDFIKETK